MSRMNDFITAFGLVLVLEGLSYAAFPEGMRRALTQALQYPNGLLRRMGLLAAITGLFVIYLVRG